MTCRFSTQVSATRPALGNPTSAHPAYRRRQLGRTLRKLREAAGLSQEDAGRPLRFSTSKMSRIEQGFIPGYNDFLALLDRYGIISSDYAKEKGW
ncbi:helix-turn-helix domain-containing protein [Amycolatopsis sp. NPDC101161]|uniref:helix-turn-helix domain-containing protein n=1 Tax=Amycolatopsis sp. NPDC101161 TaxID=3363940 RepID=UPI0038066A22